ncbi:phage baseplate assembly protein V [Burkholderia sp. S171]|uniref:phage baseplate assembly protein V n=1 Tax=Burkholderia sp. S171 TaxID=1641860 RepID=UPI00131CB845|nr:phage baseplate assembly protein V [Burkholderia sp. S171]
MNSNESTRQFLNGLRKGTVIGLSGALCRVESGELTTDWIQWFVPCAGETIEWLAPSIGEGVMLLCPSGDPAQAVALRGFYTEDFESPSLDPNKHIRRYRDGAFVEYDFAAHILNVDLPAGATVNVTAPDAVNINTKTANVKADKVTLDADVEVTRSMVVKGPFSFESGVSGKAGTSGGPAMVISGTVAVSDDVIAGGKSGAHHSHMEQGDGKPVSEPI